MTKTLKTVINISNTNAQKSIMQWQCLCKSMKQLPVPEGLALGVIDGLVDGLALGVVDGDEVGFVEGIDVGTAMIKEIITNIMRRKEGKQ